LAPAHPCRLGNGSGSALVLRNPIPKTGTRILEIRLLSGPLIEYFDRAGSCL